MVWKFVKEMEETDSTHWWTNIAMEVDPLKMYLTYWKWGYSIAMLVYQRVVSNPFRFTEDELIMIIAAKADVNARDQNNMTPLMGCIVGGVQTLNK